MSNVEIEGIYKSKKRIVTILILFVFIAMINLVSLGFLFIMNNLLVYLLPSYFVSWTQQTFGLLWVGGMIGFTGLLAYIKITGSSLSMSGWNVSADNKEVGTK